MEFIKSNTPDELKSAVGLGKFNPGSIEGSKYYNQVAEAAKNGIILFMQYGGDYSLSPTSNEKDVEEIYGEGFKNELDEHINHSDVTVYYYIDDDSADLGNYPIWLAIDLKGEDIKAVADIRMGIAGGWDTDWDLDKYFIKYGLIDPDDEFESKKSIKRLPLLEEKQAGEYVTYELLGKDHKFEFDENYSDIYGIVTEIFEYLGLIAFPLGEDGDMIVITKTQDEADVADMMWGDYVDAENEGDEDKAEAINDKFSAKYPAQIDFDDSDGHIFKQMYNALEEFGYEGDDDPSVEKGKIGILIREK